MFFGFSFKLQLITAEKTSMALLSHFYLYYDRVCTTAGLKDEMKSFRKDLLLVCY